MVNDKNIVKRSLLISFLERYAITALQFVSVMVMARLLTPEDIGIYTVGLAIIGIAHMLRDFGIGSYLIQEKELTKEKVSAALGITILLAWSMGVVVYLLAPYAARFYAEASVKDVIHVVALHFLIIPFGAMAPALLKRSMSFGTLMKINLSATLVNVLVGVYLAYHGHGYMSMAWASVASVTASAILAQYYLPDKYRVYPSLKNTKKILGFGSHIVGANLANVLNSSALDLMVGKVLGFSTLGFLSRGQGFVKIYTNVIQKAITPVINSHLSKSYRSGKELDSSYSNTVNYVTLVAWFALGFMGLMSYNLIRILYGDQWDAAIPIASILCVSACIIIPNSLARNLLVSTGDAKTNFRLTITFVVLRIAIIFSIVYQGLYTMLLCFLVLGTINFFVTHFIIFSKYRFQATIYITIAAKNIVIAAGALLLPLYFWLMPNSNDVQIIFFELLSASLVSGLSWLALVYILKHPIRIEINSVYKSVKNRLMRKNMAH